MNRLQSIRHATDMWTVHKAGSSFCKLAKAFEKPIASTRGPDHDRSRSNAHQADCKVYIDLFSNPALNRLQHIPYRET